MSEVYFNHTTKNEAVKQGFAPASTVAIRREGNSFVYGVAICSAYDSFSKKAGREIATARLNERFRVTPIPEGLLAFEKEVGEKQITLTFLYMLSKSITASPKKWVKKVTKFNRSNESTAKVVRMIASPKLSSKTPQPAA